MFPSEALPPRRCCLDPASLIPAAASVSLPPLRRLPRPCQLCRRGTALQGKCRATQAPPGTARAAPLRHSWRPLSLHRAGLESKAIRSQRHGRWRTRNCRGLWASSLETIDPLFAPNATVAGVAVTERPRRVGGGRRADGAQTAAMPAGNSAVMAFDNSIYEIYILHIFEGE